MIRRVLLCLPLLFSLGCLHDWNRGVFAGGDAFHCDRDFSYVITIPAEADPQLAINCAGESIWTGPLSEQAAGLFQSLAELPRTVLGAMLGF